MRRTPRLPPLALFAALAACGGKAAPATTSTPTPQPGTTMPVVDDPATPFDERAVHRQLAAVSGLPDCLGESATLGEHMAEQHRIVGGLEEFSCAPSDDGAWACTWSALTMPAEPSPDDPCAEPGARAGFLVIVPVEADGTPRTGELFCNAPG